MKIILVAGIICIVISSVLFLNGFAITEKEPQVSWREDFSSVPEGETPPGWRLKGKPGTEKAKFSVEKEKDISFLRMEADNESASLLTDIKGLDLLKTPILSWRWRAVTLPKGADGRFRSKDDQAIGVYVGTGSVLNNKSISYRWDTDTPKGSEGNVTYGVGTVNVKWFTLRNKEDLKKDQWYTEKRNFLEDFEKAWGFVPNKIYLGISCNSQYTGTHAAADLEWIELESEK